MVSAWLAPQTERRRPEPRSAASSAAGSGVPAQRATPFTYQGAPGRGGSGAVSHQRETASSRRPGMPPSAAAAASPATAADTPDTAKIVIRTLDAGSDKPLAFVDSGVEANPALGVRGLRVATANPALLEHQLDAIAAAAAQAGATPWVMAPMVATVEETEYFVALARDYGLKTAGVMVEVPSSALLADRVLAYVAPVLLGGDRLALTDIGVASIG